MLDSLKKAVGIQPKENMEQDAPKQEMSSEVFGSETLLTQLAEANEMLAANQEIIAGLNSNIANMANEIEGYKQKLESLQEFAKEAEAKALAAAEEMKAKELADKKAQLADIIGADNPDFDKMFNSLEGLNAEAFNVVLSGFKASFEAEAKSEMFVQLGVSGEAEPKAEDEGATARILKKQFNSK